MAWSDKLKQLGQSITGQDEDESVVAEPESEEAGPSNMVRSALSAAASTMLGGSKKVVDLVLSKYRPELQLDVILLKEDVETLIADRERLANVPLEQLVLAASQNTETFVYVQELLEEFASTKGVDVEVAVHLAALVDLVDLVVTRHPEAYDRAMTYVVDHSEFRHPLISTFMARETHKRSEAPEWRVWWTRQALFFYPLNAELLQLLGSSVDGHEAEVSKMLLDLATAE